MLNSIQTFPDKECGTGASVEEIAETERLLGVSLLVSSRAFMRNFGWASFAHETLYGIGKSVPKPYELVRNAMAEWSVMMPAMPVYLIPLLNDGAGNHYCLNTLRREQGECPVVFWDNEQSVQQVPKEVATSFAEWLVDYLKSLKV